MMKYLYRLTNRQKKLGVYLGVIVLVSLLWLFLIHIPMNSKLRELEKNDSSLSLQIEKIRDSACRDVRFQECLASLKSALQKLNQKFLTSSDSIFRDIEEFARDFNIEISSINPGETLELKEGEKRVQFEGRQVFVLPLELRLKANFIDFGKFLEKIDVDFPGLIVLSKLSINQPIDRGQLLDIIFNCNVYYLDRKNE